MLRLSPPGYNRFIQANSFDINYGGSEANVSFSLANYNIETEFVTKLPDNEMGRATFNKLRQYGVGINHIVYGGRRLGIYYMEKGASQRPSKVIYDRAFSSISEAESCDFDWETIFEDASWFHFSGITPALSDNLAEITLEACIVAKSMGISISCDLNYRSKLWTQEKANKVMTKLIKYVDVCIANEEDIEKVFDIKASDSDVDRGILNYESYKEVAREIHERFGCKYIACTLRTSISASDNKWTSLIYYGNKCYQSKEYSIHITDRVGGGDSFVAGLIYGFMKNMNIDKTMEFATAASCLKQTIEGDFNLVTEEEVNLLANGNASGRVQR